MSETNSEVDYYNLDAFGNEDHVFHTTICFCFAVPSEASYSVAINHLQNGIQRLSKSFPWLAGKVVNVNSGQDKKPMYKVQYTGSVPFIIKDWREDPAIPSLDTLRKAKFPINMGIFQEKVVSPCKRFPKESEDKQTVLIVQVNMIKGGLVLAIATQHQVTDMTGHQQIMELLSKACYGEEFTAEELSIGNVERSNIIPLLEDIVEPANPSNKMPDRQISKQDPLDPSQLSQAYIKISPEAAIALKSAATESVESGYITTDDAVSALIWRSVVRARMYRLGPDTISMCTRVVDCRKFVKLPASYVGVIVNQLFLKLPLKTVIEEPLGRIASRLRQLIVPEAIGPAFLEMVTHLSRGTKSLAQFFQTTDLFADCLISSWAKYKCYDLEFNLGLGKAEAVLKPGFETPRQSMVFIQPKEPEGGWSLMICLMDEDMQRLKTDEELQKYAEYIG